MTSYLTQFYIKVLTMSFRSYNHDKALGAVVSIWFAAALLGQLVFAIYIVVRYGLPIINDEYQNINLSNNITGYVKGDFSGNVMLYVHPLPAQCERYAAITPL
jgi:hypothetical protein